MKEEQPLIPIIKTLWQWRKTIIATAVITGILSSGIMLLKPNYYRSSTLFYPVNSALLEPVSNRDQSSPGYYGNDHDVDRLLSIGSSHQLVSATIHQFDLADHYKIDTSSAKGKHKVMKRFRKLYDIRKTPYDAIEVSMEDIDPSLATNMSKFIREFIDTKALDVAKQSQASIIASLKSSISTKTDGLSTITDSISNIRQRYGIYDTKSQGEALAAMEIKSPGSTQVKKRIANYNAGISEIIKLEVRQEALSKSLAFNQDKLNDVMAAYGERPSALHVIEEASVPLEKSRPRRSLYVIGSIILVTGLAKLLILALTYSDKLLRETN